MPTPYAMNVTFTMDEVLNILSSRVRSDCSIPDDSPITIVIYIEGNPSCINQSQIEERRLLITRMKQEDGKIQQIKLFRLATNAGLGEAKLLVESTDMQEEFIRTGAF